VPAPARLWRAFFSLESPAWRRRANDAGEQARIEAALDWLATGVAPPGPVVDLGCGSGNFALALARRGYDVTGIDVAPGMLAAAEAARRQAELANARFERGDLGRPLDLPTGAFGGAICHFVLQYVGGPAQLLREVRRVLRPGGCLFLAAAATDFRPTGIGPRPRRLWRVRLVASRVPGVMRRYSEEGLRAELTDAGFVVLDYRRYPGGHGFLARMPA
jgi:SAM-dependent methyltransferase